jgi:type I restriction enzyme M protein
LWLFATFDTAGKLRRAQHHPFKSCQPRYRSGFFCQPIRHDDVLFVNVSNHFQKGKRQNQLLPEHIVKIIDTYQFRKEEERYARRVPMAEIAANDFNLNISRYISTAVADEQIDLSDVNSKLVELETSIEQATRKHNGFLEELGLPPLP